jgi:hypothetical protein
VREDERTTQLERMEEYKSLRQEILALAGQASSIVQFALAFGAAYIVAVASLKTPGPLVWLVSWFVLFPLFWKTHALYQEIYLVGHYIEVFIERKTTGLRWQTRWAALNQGNAKIPWVNWCITRLSQHSTIVLGIQVATAVIAFWQSNCAFKQYWYWWLIVLIILLWEITVLLLALSPRRLKKMQEAWQCLDGGSTSPPMESGSIGGGQNGTDEDIGQ